MRPPSCRPSRRQDLDGVCRNQRAVLEIAPTWIHRTGKPVVVGVLNEKYEDEHVPELTE